MKSPDLALIAAVVPMAVGMVAIRGWHQGMAAIDIFWAIAGGLAFCAVYFPMIHYLLKGWDRLWARIRGKAVRP